MIPGGAIPCDESDCDRVDNWVEYWRSDTICETNPAVLSELSAGCIDYVLRGQECLAISGGVDVTNGGY